jgi:hypothetical protein
VRRYRTQEVAGSSPASSIEKGPANGAFFSFQVSERRERADPKRWSLSLRAASEYQGLPDLDANANEVAIEHLKLEHEGFERDDEVPEPDER